MNRTDYKAWCGRRNSTEPPQPGEAFAAGFELAKKEGWHRWHDGCKDTPRDCGERAYHREDKEVHTMNRCDITGCYFQRFGRCTIYDDTRECKSVNNNNLKSKKK